MPETVTCPECGTANVAGAHWCNLCFAKFDPVPSGPVAGATSERSERSAQAAPTARSHSSHDRRGDADTPASAGGPVDERSRPVPGEQLSLIQDADRAWHCQFCDTRVDVELTNCPACQQSIYDSFGYPSSEQPRVDPATAIKWSALPGAGHRLVGQGILGVSIAAVVAVGLIFGFIMIRAGRASYGVGVLFIGLGTWLASVHDAARIARQEMDEVLLRPRVLSVLAGVMFMIVIAAAMSAQPAIRQ